MFMQQERMRYVVTVSYTHLYLSICHRVDIQCYVEDDLQLLDIGKPENLEKAEELLSKL